MRRLSFLRGQCSEVNSSDVFFNKLIKEGYILFRRQQGAALLHTI